MSNVDAVYIWVKVTIKNLKKLGLSNYKISQLTGVSEPVLSKIISGKTRHIRSDIAAKILLYAYNTSSYVKFTDILKIVNK